MSDVNKPLIDKECMVSFDIISGFWKGESGALDQYGYENNSYHFGLLSGFNTDIEYIENIMSFYYAGRKTGSVDDGSLMLTVPVNKNNYQKIKSLLEKKLYITVDGTTNYISAPYVTEFGFNTNLTALYTYHGHHDDLLYDWLRTIFLPNDGVKRHICLAWK
ncbi:DUF7823 domain-containing protein [Xenorhabdus sp. KK7.4]|uniref:DUF7823 domain-containing protein n=1 Tax=Xenorhabdus sp. KK7.4 TaxID=1851572 RepID=UPI000C0402A7|nr:hypothetical protein [Xenorhabdus sp. KK7.4]PHM57006.1 hypothetical protein Xekk_01575 [Xenorhabdus sp. KK7.4]